MPKKLDCRNITSVTQLRRCGFGVDAEIKLKKQYINKFSGEDIGPAVGTKGKVVGTFGSQPAIRWQKPGRYGAGPQVVPPEFLKVVKRSAKPEVIGTISLDKLKKSDLTHHIDDSKVTVRRTEPVFDDAGFIVGDASYELRGKLKDNKVEFISSRVDMSGVPRSHRYVIRQYFESQSPKDIFYPLLEER